MPVSARERAVVIGGSVAGLLAARVLSEHYALVTVVERDRLAARPGHRRGVPHDRHFHGLLPHGQQLIEDLLPGVTGALISDGALVGDVLAHARWYVRGRMLCQADTGLTMLSASRPLIEAALRDRVRSLPNVRMLDGHRAIGLSTSADQRRVTAVRIDGHGDRSLEADLVVDASGRGSPVQRWLSELGYPAPPADRVSIGLRYVSRIFAASRTVFGADIMVAIAPPPRSGRSGVMQLIEGGRVLVTLAGVRGDRPPLDPEGFASYASTLAAPDIHQLIQASPPLTGLAQFHCPAYERRRYERLADFPAGLLLLGDAVCSFNPVYSEGITAAARAAVALRDQLCQDSEPRAEEFFRAVSAILDAPWGLAASADLTAADSRQSGLRAWPLTARYTASLEAAAADDTCVSTAYVRVAALVDPPSALLSPVIQERVAAARVHAATNSPAQRRPEPPAAAINTGQPVPAAHAITSSPGQ
jgi:2-polyprenyl-6-methoxyphenol hydroxylase-like FAD-dependent oxidoreductase